MQDELGFPDKADPRRGWTPAELNSILQNHVVRNRDGSALTTFGCVEWESELYRGVLPPTYACQMLPVEYAQAPFSQDEPAGYPMLSLVMHVYHRISWDISG